MRVMVFGLRALLAQGGVEAHVRDIVTAIAANYPDICHFEIIERRRYARPLPQQVAGIVTTPLWSPGSAGAETIVHSLFAVLYAGIKRPDIVHIHAIGPSLVAPLARLLGLRVVCTHHGEDYRREKWGRFARNMLQLGERCAAVSAHALIAIAPGLAGRLSHRYGRQFHYIPNAARVIPMVSDETVLAEWGLSSGRYILNVGRLVPEKRQLDLVAAFRALAPGHDYKLVLVGGSDTNSSYPARVAEAAAGDPRIVITGQQPRAVLDALYRHAGLFVLPSSHEGLPIALLEAMSCNLPILVSDIEPLTDLGLPPDCYIPLGSVADLTTRLADHLAGPRDPVDWSAFLRPFHLDAVAARTLEVYQRAARRSGRDR